VAAESHAVLGYGCASIYRTNIQAACCDALAVSHANWIVVVASCAIPWIQKGTRKRNLRWKSLANTVGGNSGSNEFPYGVVLQELCKRYLSDPRLVETFRQYLWCLGNKESKSLTQSQQSPAAFLHYNTSHDVLGRCGGTEHFR
jgi:hypothetical protein